MTTMMASPSIERMTVTQPPAPPQSAPPFWPPPPVRRRSSGVFTAIVGLIAVAALIVGIVSLATRPAATTVAVPSPAPAAPAFTNADRNTAKERVCKTFSSVSDGVSTATNASDGTEPIATAVNARAAVATGALALSRSLSAATPPDVTQAVNGLVDSYTTYLLSAFGGSATQNEADFKSMVNATHALRAMCG